MMNRTFILLLNFIALWNIVSAQSYTSYFTGNPEDIISNPAGGICLMGGATEDDEAMKWFLQRADGGDILVLRASGSDGYNEYMYSSLGISVNSVETIVFHSAEASNDPYIIDKISKAEAIWFAGGNQWNYISYWRNSSIDSTINEGIIKRNIAIGGTSAGMAILGGWYFTAENGTVGSDEALQNPYNDNMTIDSTHFIDSHYLGDVITDTHYDDRDRKGRHVAFLARILVDSGISARGIACDEYTAVCIDTSGVAKVYGEYPTYDDNAYFIQVNCELDNVIPESCTPNQPLDWNLEGRSIKVYMVKGTLEGSNTFDLKDWKSGVGGAWEDWHVTDGVFVEQPGEEINCLPISMVTSDRPEQIKVYPNPVHNKLIFEETNEVMKCEILDIKGRILKSVVKSGNIEEIDVSGMEKGIYLLKLHSDNGTQILKFIKG